MILKLIGIILVVDALLSLILPNDHRLWWDIGRWVRLVLGVMVVILG